MVIQPINQKYNKLIYVYNAIHIIRLHILYDMHLYFTVITKRVFLKFHYYFRYVFKDTGTTKKQYLISMQNLNNQQTFTYFLAY